MCHFERTGEDGSILGLGFETCIRRKMSKHNLFTTRQQYSSSTIYTGLFVIMTVLHPLLIYISGARIIYTLRSFHFVIFINKISNIECKKKLFGFHSYIRQGFWDWTRMQIGPDYALFNRATYGNLSTHKHWIREPKRKSIHRSKPGCYIVFIRLCSVQINVSTYPI